MLVEEHAQWRMHDVSYCMPESSQRVQAWFIVPSGSDRFPFVVFLHGGAQNRGVFLSEAVSLADTGIASLLIDLPQARVWPDFSHPEKDHATFLRTVISVRRGLDYLAAHGDIDITRGGLAGLSFGGSIGCMIAAIDTRVRTAVLIATVPRMTEFWRLSSLPEVLNIREALSPDEMNFYTEASQVFDAIEYLHLCSNKRLLFQYGADDEVISAEQRSLLLPFTSGHSRLTVYSDTTHLGILLNPEARRDRLRWLADELQAG